MGKCAVKTACVLQQCNQSCDDRRLGHNQAGDPFDQLGLEFGQAGVKVGFGDQFIRHLHLDPRRHSLRRLNHGASFVRTQDVINGFDLY